MYNKLCMYVYYTPLTYIHNKQTCMYNYTNKKKQTQMSEFVFFCLED